MAIFNPGDLSSGDLGTITWGNGIKDNSINLTDDIHEQYDGIKIMDLTNYGLVWDFSDSLVEMYKMPVDRSTPLAGTYVDNHRFRDASAVEFVTYLGGMVFFEVKNTVSINVDFNILTQLTTTADNWAELVVSKYTSAGIGTRVYSPGTKYASTVAVNWRKVSVNITMAAIGVSSSDFLNVYLALGVDDTAGSDRSLEQNGLIVERVFA